eukprot:PhM_4_TR12641/c0_g1_i1/m.100166
MLFTSSHPPRNEKATVAATTNSTTTTVVGGESDGRLFGFVCHPHHRGGVARGPTTQQQQQQPAISDAATTGPRSFTEVKQKQKQQQRRQKELGRIVEGEGDGAEHREAWVTRMLKELLDAAAFPEADFERVVALAAKLRKSPMTVSDEAVDSLGLEKTSLECFRRCRERLSKCIANVAPSVPTAQVTLPTQNIRKLRRDGRFFYSTPLTEQQRIDKSRAKKEKQREKKKQKKKVAATTAAVSTTASDVAMSCDVESDSNEDDDDVVYCVSTVNCTSFVDLNANACTRGGGSSHSKGSVTCVGPCRRKDNGDGDDDGDGVPKLHVLSPGTDLTGHVDNWPAPTPYTPEDESKARLSTLVMEDATGADVVCSASTMRALISMPFTSQATSFTVYRIGETLVLGTVHRGPEDGLALETAKDTHEEALRSKFMFRSLGLDKKAVDRALQKQQRQHHDERALTQTQSSDAFVGGAFSRTLLWRFQDVNITVGVEGSVARDPETGEEVIIKLRDADGPELSSDELQEMWLESLLSNVHTHRIAYHTNGVVARYERVRPAELLGQERNDRGRAMVEDIASKVLHWVRQACAFDLSAYTFRHDPTRQDGALQVAYCESYDVPRCISDRPESNQRTVEEAQFIFTPSVVAMIKFRSARKILSRFAADYHDVCPAIAYEALQLLHHSLHYFVTSEAARADTIMTECRVRTECIRLHWQLGIAHYNHIYDEEMHRGKNADGASCRALLGKRSVIEETFARVLVHYNTVFAVMRKHLLAHSHDNPTMLDKYLTLREEVLNALFTGIDRLCNANLVCLPPSFYGVLIDVLNTLSSACCPETRPEDDPPYTNLQRACCTRSLASLYILALKARERCPNLNIVPTVETLHGECLHVLYKRYKGDLVEGEKEQIARLLSELHMSNARIHVQYHRFTKALTALRTALATPDIDALTRNEVYVALEDLYLAQAALSPPNTGDHKDKMLALVQAVPVVRPSTLVAAARCLTCNFERLPCFEDLHAVVDNCLHRAAEAYREAGDADGQADAEYYLGVLGVYRLEAYSIDCTNLEKRHTTFAVAMGHLRRAQSYVSQRSVQEPHEPKFIERILETHVKICRLYFVRGASSASLAQVQNGLEELLKARQYFEPSTIVAPVGEDTELAFISSVQESTKRALALCRLLENMTTCPLIKQKVPETGALLHKLCFHAVTESHALNFLTAIASLRE